MKLLMTIFVCALVNASCAGGSPDRLGLSKGSLHVSVDGATCRGLGAVTVFIDGTSVGTVRPGDGGVRQDFPIGAHGAHNVSASAVSLNYRWTAETVTVPEAGFEDLLSCTF